MSTQIKLAKHLKVGDKTLCYGEIESIELHGITSVYIETDRYARHGFSPDDQVELENRTKFKVHHANKELNQDSFFLQSDGTLWKWDEFTFTGLSKCGLGYFVEFIKDNKDENCEDRLI